MPPNVFVHGHKVTPSLFFLTTNKDHKEMKERLKETIFR